MDGNAEEDVFKVYMRDCGLFVSMLEDGTQYDIYHVNSAIKLGDYNVGRAEQILTLPLYMAFLLRTL